MLYKANPEDAVCLRQVIFKAETDSSVRQYCNKHVNLSWLRKSQMSWHQTSFYKISSVVPFQMAYKGCNSLWITQNQGDFQNKLLLALHFLQTRTNAVKRWACNFFTECIPVNRLPAEQAVNAGFLAIEYNLDNWKINVCAMKCFLQQIYKGFLDIFFQNNILLTNKAIQCEYRYHLICLLECFWAN